MEDVFAVIAEGTRREILAYLRSGERSVGQLVEELKVSQPTVSKHLKVLREAGLVSMRAQGQKRYYSLETAPLHDILEWLDSFRRNDPRLADRLGAPGGGDRAAGRNQPPHEAPVDGASESRGTSAVRPEILAAGALVVPESIPATNQGASSGVPGAEYDQGAPTESTRQQHHGKTVGRATMGRAAERAADLLSQLRRRRDQER